MMLRLEGLSKRYGRLVALAGVSLEVAPGEIFGFLGPNGAGKTTTIKIITGLMRPSEGKVYIAGIDITSEPVKAKRLIGYIPETPFLYQKLTGREFLSFICSIYEIDKAEATRRMQYFIDLFEMEDWIDELIEGYSHGMRQRLVMSASLIHRPSLLVVDEPLVGLDPRGARLIKGIFREQAQRGTAIFLSTHTLYLAQEICHRIAIINKGKLIAVGTLQELRSQASSQDTELEKIFLKLTSADQVTDYGPETTDNKP